METKRLGKTPKQISIYLFIILALAWMIYTFVSGDIQNAFKTKAESFTLILWSILLEALPFVLIGTIISSLIQVFVTEETIIKVLPKNNFLRLVFASLIGLIFPVCECAIIPITRGLIKKGMPIGPAFAFMIATPIVNPVVLLSTYNAFNTMPSMFIYRGIGGFIGAILIGFIVGRSNKNVLKQTDSQIDCACGHDHHESCGCDHDHHDYAHTHRKRKFWMTVKQVLAHTNNELQSVGMYLIFGAIIATSMQLFVPRDVLLSLGGGRIFSILIMMLLAFVLSLCSEADAFIASTFMLQFSSASIFAFLITGPMIDIKNTMMLFGSFKRKFVIKLIAVILVVCFVLALVASIIMGGTYA